MREWYTGPQNVCSGGPVYEVNTYVPKGRNEGGRIATPTSSQWSVFNNYSLDINSETTFFLCWISFINNNLRNLCPSEKKKIIFHIWKKIFHRQIVISKFQEPHFCFYDPFWCQKFWRCTLTFVFFFMTNENLFCFPNSTCWIFFL